MRKHRTPKRFRYKSFSLFNRLKKRKIASDFLFITLLAVFFHFFSAGIKDRARSAAISIRIGIFNTMDEIQGLVSNFRYFFSRDMNKVMLDLRNENIQLRQENEDMARIKSENDELRKALSLKESSKFETIVAKVVTIFSNDFLRSCIINVGTTDGIQVNDVLKNQDGLIGRVVKVNNSWSEALFITDTNSNIPVKIGEDGINGILSGDNSNRMRVSVIHEDISLKNNDLVETSGYGNVFCEKIPVGRVVEKNGGFFVIPFVNFDHLRYVIVVKKNFKSDVL